MVQTLVTGVDIGHHSIKAVVLKPAGDKCTLLGYQEIFVSDDIFADNHTLDYQKIVKKLKELKKGLPRFSRKVVVAIPDTSVISKVLQIDSELDVNEQEFAIHQAFSHQSPFPTEELYLDFVPLAEKMLKETKPAQKSSLAFQVYATKREAVESRSLALQKAGFTPVLADVQSQALVHLWQALSQTYQKNDWLLIDVGMTQTSLYLDLANKAPFYKQITLNLPSQSDDEPEVNPSVFDAGEWLKKVTKQIQLFTSVYGDHSIKGIWLCGGGTQVAPLFDAVVEQTDFMCGIVDPFSLFQDKSAKRYRCDQLAASFATATGLALRGLNWLEAGHAA